MNNPIYSTVYQTIRFAAIMLACVSTFNAYADDIPSYKLASAYKSNTVGNPLSPWMLCADPTAVEYNGRLYVYGTNDQQEYNTTKNASNNTYGKITQLVVFSSEDLVNWTHHGVIDVKSVCTWCWASWAPSVTSRVESDGKTHFYMYFTNGASGIGVMTATSPLGPWTDPIKKALIDGNTQGRGKQSNIIDPGVAVDENGTGWLTFGGGEPNSSGSVLIPGNARIVKLGKNMCSFSTKDIVEIPAPYHFEANELNIVNGKFIFSYSSSWSGRSDSDWSKYKSDNSEKKITAAKPGICSIAYMISEDPLDKNSWKYMGDVLPNPSNFGYPGGNNHSHFQKFGNNWYMIYHTQWLAKKMGFSGGYRNISMNKMTVNETTGALTKVSMNDTGAPALANTLNPYEWVPAETMANCAGVTTEAYSTRGNTVIANIDAGDWTLIRNVQFGDEGADSIQVKTVTGSGQLLVFLDRPSGTPVGVITIPTGRPLTKAGLSQTVTGKHNVFFVWSQASKIKFDSWRVFHPELSEGIEDNVKVEKNQNERIYNLQGQQVNTLQKGVNIVDGKKVLIR